MNYITQNSQHGCGDVCLGLNFVMKNRYGSLMYIGSYERGTDEKVGFGGVTTEMCLNLTFCCLLESSWPMRRVHDPLE